MSGLFFHNDESGYDESFGEGMSTSMEFGEKTATEYDRLSTKLTLRRLLYRMERYEDLTVLQNENEDEDSDHCQSWQSLLVRAQLCQSLWQNVAAENVDEGSDPQLRKEYMELSQRVDAACKRAQFLADQAREQEIAQGKDQDLVGKLFFSHPVSDDESEAAQGEGVMPREEGESDQEDDYYGEFEDNSDGESVTENPSRQPKTHSNNQATPNLQDLQKAQREQIEEAIAMMAKQMKESTQGIRKTLQTQNANTLNELENVAEQNMEDVSKVASNVKEHVVANQKSSWATWTTMILILGLFVFTLVTIFTIPKHPDANLGRILSGANESGPYARLLQKTIQKVQSVFGNGEPNEQTTAVDEQHQEGENWEDYEIPQDNDTSDVQERLNQLVRDMQSGGRKTQQEKQQEKLKQQEQQKQEQEERLRKLQEELQEKERLRREEKLREEKRQAEEQLRQQKLQEEKQQREEKIRKQNLELEKRQKEAQEQREKIRQKKLQEQERLKRLKLKEEEEEKLKLQRLEEERQVTEKDDFNDDAEEPEEDDANLLDIESEEEPEPATDNASADDILASLKNRQQEPIADTANVEPEKKEEDDTVEPFKPPQLDREGVAAKMVSPRDFRLAAASNDLETLERYLEMAPEHINRQDKHGWTALHMAVHGNHERIVALLLSQTHDRKDMADLNIDPFVKSYEEKRTALDLALEQFGLEHPITEAFFGSGWYERSEYKDWGDEEARLRKQKLEEHEARIAKEKEAIKAKEAKYAAAAEEERRIKKDKLDKLFGTPVEEDEDDELDEETLQERRGRLDVLLGEL